MIRAATVAYPKKGPGAMCCSQLARQTLAHTHNTDGAHIEELIF